MQIIIKKKFSSFPHFLKTYSQADLLLPVFPHTILCKFLQITISIFVTSHHYISACDSSLKQSLLQKEMGPTTFTITPVMACCEQGSPLLCHFRIKGSGSVTDSVRNKKFGEDHLLKDLVTTLTLEVYTCKAQVVSPWQAFITVLLRNHIIDLTEMNLLGVWQQMYCFLPSHPASQIRSGSSKNDSGPTTQSHSSYFFAALLHCIDTRFSEECASFPL